MSADATAFVDLLRKGRASAILRTLPRPTSPATLAPPISATTAAPVATTATPLHGNPYSSASAPRP